MSARLVEFLEDFVFSKRLPLLFILLLATAFFGFHASKLAVDAGFEKQLPLRHPYMQTFLQHRNEFGGANRLMISVRAKRGDIFSEHFFKTLKEVTDEVFYLPGVDRGTLKSLFTPNVRFIEIVEGGFSGGNVIPADFSPTSEGLAQVRQNILKSGIVGRLVANDFSAAMVSAHLVEQDPTTGEKLDYLKVAKLLEENIRRKFVNEEIDIHIIGFAKAMGDVAEGAKGVLVFFAISFVITAVLVYLFTASWKLTAMPLVCSIVAVIWNLGILTLFDFGIDPMSILVPFLVFAIGVSHGVQMINIVASVRGAGVPCEQGARAAFRSLFIPGTVALISDTVGFLTILLIDIRIIQELAITASIGVLVIIVTNLFLLPILLSYLKLDDGFVDRYQKTQNFRERFWRFLALFCQKRIALKTIIVATLLLGWGLWEGANLKIGDIHEGVPELRQSSRYNQDTRAVTSAFSIGVDIINVIVESVPDGCTFYDVMEAIDRFQWVISNVPGVQSTISLPQVAKIINAGWNEGNLAWRVLPRNPQTMAQAVGSVETATGLLNRDCSVMPVMIFTEDHKAETIERIVLAVKEFAANNDSPRHKFRLATGNVGVMAATNEVVKENQFMMLLYVYGAVMLLCFTTFKNLRTVFRITVPLALVSVLCYALMSLLEIGLKTSTLPVAALGVGIGVDYAIYISSQLRQHLSTGMNLQDAYMRTLQGTGSAVLVTGLTLAIGVSTWIFSALKFQADMGVLLTFMFLANMIGALMILPAIAVFTLRKPTETEKKHGGIGRL